MAHTRNKSAEVSSLKLHNGCEGIAAFFEMLLEKVLCADGRWRVQLKSIGRGEG